jgi:hypothetical protein
MRAQRSMRRPGDLLLWRNRPLYGGAAQGDSSLAVKIDALLKLSVIVSLLLASSGIAYYYAVYLPRRDSERDRESILQRLHAYGQTRADQERSAVRQREAEQRQAEAKASAGIRYQNCVDDARTSHDASWAAACKRLAEKVVRDRTDCLSIANLPQGYCDAAYGTRDPSEHCTLPVEMAADLDAALSRARGRCQQERNAALQ